MSATTGTSSLLVDGVTSGYGNVTVLRDVSLRVGRGEIVAILGANGAGKSTLLKTVVGLLKPTAGTVQAHGLDITGEAPETITRRNVVLVPEGRQLFDTMTVRENLILGSYTQPRSNRDEDMERVRSLFPILREREGQKVSSLSGGQRQMVAIGRALMARPTLLLLDEPSLGLAPLIIKETFDTLARLRDDGVTILIVEQNAMMTLRLADRAYVLTRGQVTMEGRADELLRDPRIQQAYLGIGARDGAVATAPAGAKPEP
jgi:branched-chain amino acid transport system ATP-binding protein